MRCRRLARGWKWGTLAAVAMALVAAFPAGATIYERGTFHDEWSFPTEDCGIVLQVVGSADGKFRVRTGKNKTQSAFFQHVNVSFSETYTSPTTGEWFLVRGHSVFNEVKAERVRGTIFKFTAVEAGQPFVLENSDGEIVMRDRGVIRYTILFDTLGDETPGGDFIEEVDVRVRGPHPGFFADFCEVATELVG
jgi:hypothetical protein